MLQELEWDVNENRGLAHYIEGPGLNPTGFIICHGCETVCGTVCLPVRNSAWTWMHIIVFGICVPSNSINKK